MSLVLAAGAAVSVSFLATEAKAQYTWINPSTGSMSAAANWLSPPGLPPQHTSSTTLTFSPGNIGATTNATNDVGGITNQTFNVNAMTFNNSSVGFNFVVGNNNSSHNTFEFDPGSSLATITMQGYGPSFGSSGIAGAQMKLTTDLTIVGSGIGNLGLNNPIFEDSTPRSVTVANTPVTQLTGIVALGSPGTTAGNSNSNPISGNWFSNELVLDGGNLGCSGAGPGEFGIGRFRVTNNGGTLYMSANTAGVRFTTLQVNGALRILGNSSGGLQLTTPTGESVVPTLSGSGNILINGMTTITLAVGNDSSAYNGTITVDRFDYGQLINTLSTRGGVQLLNANGNLRGVSTFNMRDGGILYLANSAASQAANLDRVANSATINLASGLIRLIGTGSGSSPQVNVTEVFGTINGSGFSTLTAELASGGNKSTTINAEAFSRVDHGTFLFRGDSLGLLSGGLPTLTANGTPNGDGTLNFDGSAATSYIALPAALSADMVGGDGSLGTNKKILPYAVGATNSTGSGINLVTLDTINGTSAKLSARPLATAEYAGALGANATDNVRLTASTANTSDATVNSLVLGTSGAVTGSATLSVTSGAILSATTATTAGISNNIAFGSTEGQIFTQGAGGLTISGNLTGNNGLTKSGSSTSVTANTLFLRGDNSQMQGQLTINAGAVDFNSDAALAGTGQIVSNGAGVDLSSGSGTALQYSGTTAYSLTRDVAAHSGWMSFKTAGTGSLTVAGQISGPAAVNFNSTLGGADITVAPTAGSNTYTGPTRLAGGNIHLASDACLGNGGAVSLDAATVVLDGDWTTSRVVNFGTNSAQNAGASINTNGHNATLNGPLTNFNGAFGLNTAAAIAFTKAGAGSLTLNSNSSNLGSVVTVSGGSLIVNGTIPGSANAVTVAAGATLGGSGQIWRNTTVNGTLAPGNSPGMLTFSGSGTTLTALTLGSGATMSMQLNGPVAGTGYDQVVVNSLLSTGAAVALGAGTANLSLSLGYAPAGTDMFWLISNTNAASTTTGNFLGLVEGATVTLGVFGGHTYTAQISYNGNFATGQADHTGNDVVLYNVVKVKQCGSADFNCDGDIGTDLDIEAFFACLAGSCPSAPCTNNADFNDDGDIGTDADIEAFFRVLAGGPC